MVAAFPMEPTLHEQGLADSVGRLYVDCFERGELIQCGGAAVDVRELVLEGLERFGVPSAVVADRWREAELRDALQSAGAPRAALVLRGMGFLDGGQDVREFRRACLESRVVPGPSLLLRSAIGEARVATDAAGNQKLAKGSEGGRRLRARDDAAAASVLAVATGSRRPEKPRGAYLGLVA